MDHEDRLLEESANREAESQQRITSLEIELRTIQLVCMFVVVSNKIKMY